MVAKLEDVAKRAGVSAGTASKVLKNYNNISQKTKDKVMKAVQELNYIPNSNASALASKHHDKVALYIYINDLKQAIDEINMQYLQGAFSQAKELGMDVVSVFNQSVSQYNAQELSIYFLKQGISAIVVYGLNKEDEVIHQLIEEGLFYITVVDAPIENEKTSSVMVDHFNGQYDVAKKLVTEHNAKNILYLAGKRNGYVTDLRLDGIKKLEKELKLNVQVEHADFSEIKAYQYTQKYGHQVDAVICASDLMAIGAVNGLKRLEIFRPCSGYDGITLMGYAAKGVLTCKSDFYETSRQAIVEIQRLLDGEKGRIQLLDYQLITIQYEDVIM